MMESQSPQSTYSPETHEIDHTEEDIEEDPCKVPFSEKEAGDRFFKEGKYSDAQKCYSKALLAIKILVKDNKIEPIKLINEYSRQVIVRNELTADTL